MVIMGLVAMLCGYRTVVTSYDSMNWLSTQGEITHSRMKESITSGQYEDKTLYSAEIRYRYWIGGREYTGSNVRFSMPDYYTPEEVQPVLDRYREESQVTVYYDPENHEEAVLEKMVDKHTYSLLYAGTVWTSIWGMALLISALVVYFKEVRRKKR